MIRVLPLTTDDTERIISALKARELIEYVVVKSGPGSEKLVSFLERFWKFEDSPYIREKLLHKHHLN
jgi:hypothetical protein